ncbi:hypothetical protein OSB04_004991 [Centaurea solstitialis]|uniref:Uncharacterized protein n=1 Tax=Centaurea solstitialis TaxID=347529 RepID=A0AA38TT06_9ASTR|nr:hypothetical protein OSB04_004991 [Centaurea solstitialis]
MVMRPRGSEVNSNRPQRTSIGRVYEQFKPIFEWKQQDDCHNLLIYLPGNFNYKIEFCRMLHMIRKESIEVTVEYPNGLRVRGERLVVGNKWNKIIDASVTTTTTLASKMPMKKAKQDHTDSTKPSSYSTLDATDQAHRPQPMVAKHGGLQPPLDRAKSTKRITNRVKEYKISVVVMVATTLVIALGVYVSYVINGSSSYKEFVKQHINLN